MEPVKFAEFGSSANLIRQIGQIAEEINRAEIPQTPAVPMTFPNRQEVPFKGVGLVLHMRDGHSLLLRSDDAEALLNDGFLTRNKIQVSFL